MFDELAMIRDWQAFGSSMTSFDRFTAIWTAAWEARDKSDELAARGDTIASAEIEKLRDRVIILEAAIKHYIPYSWNDIEQKLREKNE